jgi:hypothetical protein
VHKTETYIDGRLVAVIDDALTAAQKIDMWKAVNNSRYKVQRIATAFLKDQPTLRSTWLEEDQKKVGFFDYPNVKKLLAEHKCKPDEVYVVIGTASDVYRYHVDNSTNNLTLLYYANLVWQPSWEGETHFSDEQMQDIRCSVSFKSGRIVLFDGSIPHKSSQPSHEAPDYRFVVVVKLKG